MIPQNKFLTILSASPIYLWDPNFAIIVPADALAPDGARLSTDTMLMLNSLAPGRFQQNLR